MSITALARWSISRNDGDIVATAKKLTRGRAVGPTSALLIGVEGVDPMPALRLLPRRLVGYQLRPQPPVPLRRLARLPCPDAVGPEHEATVVRDRQPVRQLEPLAGIAVRQVARNLVVAVPAAQTFENPPAQIRRFEHRHRGQRQAPPRAWPPRRIRPGVRCAGVPRYRVGWRVAAAAIAPRSDAGRRYARPAGGSPGRWRISSARRAASASKRCDACMSIGVTENCAPRTAGSAAPGAGAVRRPAARRAAPGPS